MHTTGQGLIQGFFLPTDTPRPETRAAERLAAGVKLFEADPAKGQLTIYPTETRSWVDDFLGPKYAQITALIIPADVYPEWDVSLGFETLPSGFTKDYEYGLGLARIFRRLLVDHGHGAGGVVLV